MKHKLHVFLKNDIYFVKQKYILDNHYTASFHSYITSVLFQFEFPTIPN